MPRTCYPEMVTAVWIKARRPTGTATKPMFGVRTIILQSTSCMSALSVGPVEYVGGLSIADR